MKTELCGKHIDTLREWRVTCGLPKDHEGYCVTIAIGGAGGGGTDGRQFAATEQLVTIEERVAYVPLVIGDGGSTPKRDSAITPREAFEAGFQVGVNWIADSSDETSKSKRIELSWEHFQAARMKAAASTEESSCEGRRRLTPDEAEATSPKHSRDCEYVTSDGPAPCTCKPKYPPGADMKGATSTEEPCG